MYSISRAAFITGHCFLVSSQSLHFSNYTQALSKREPPRLPNVSICGMIVAQLGNLRLRLPLEDVVPLATLTLLVLPLEQDRHNSQQNAGVGDAAQGDGVTERVPRLVMGAVDEG